MQLIRRLYTWEPASSWCEIRMQTTTVKESFWGLNVLRPAPPTTGSPFSPHHRVRACLQWAREEAGSSRGPLLQGSQLAPQPALHTGPGHVCPVQLHPAPAFTHLEPANLGFPRSPDSLFSWMLFLKVRYLLARWGHQWLRECCCYDVSALYPEKANAPVLFSNVLQCPGILLTFVAVSCHCQYVQDTVNIMSFSCVILNSLKPLIY